MYSSPQTAQKVFGGEVKNHLLYFISKGSDEFQAKIDDYKKAADTFRGKVSWPQIQQIFSVQEILKKIVFKKQILVICKSHVNDNYKYCLELIRCILCFKILFHC